MTIQGYIKKFVDPAFVEEQMPFEISQAHFEKDWIITDFGEVEKKVYFLCEGLVQISTQKNGQERILDFFYPGSFFSSYSSLLNQQPSDVQVISITSCQVEIIKGEDLARAYKDSLLANKLGRIATEQAYMKRVEREKDFLTKSADERYQDILKEYPQIIHQIPVHKIAAYLGIHPESLSRIRKQLIS